jgi:hypothetical protein
MKISTKSKWVVGMAGTAFTAFVLSQLGGGGNDTNVDTFNTNSLQIDSKVYASMNDKEKELVQLDWSDFAINEVNTGMGAGQSDRNTRRS